VFDGGGRGGWLGFDSGGGGRGGWLGFDSGGGGGRRGGWFENDGGSGGLGKRRERRSIRPDDFEEEVSFGRCCLKKENERED